MTWVLIGTGAALGGVARHALNQLVQQRALASAFPLGIFVVNVLGAGVIGVLAGLDASQKVAFSTHARLFLFVGVLGGFTTFSSFSLDTLVLLRSGLHTHAFANVAGQVGISLLAVWLGYRVGAAL